VQRYSAFWDEVIEENGLEFANDGRPTRHWSREDQEGKSVIDLSLENRPIVRRTILADDHVTGTDHEVREWEAGVDRQDEADHERGVGWNLEALTQTDAEAAEMLWMELAKERTQLDAECTEDVVKQEAAWYLEAMTSVLNVTAKKIRIYAM
jgi:hypothetical protein